MRRASGRPGSAALALLATGLLVGLAGVATPPAEAAGRGEAGPVFPARVELTDRQADLRRFRTMDLDVDGVFGDWARLYLTQEEFEKLRAQGFAVTALPRPAIPPGGPDAGEADTQGIPTTYHTYETLSSELADIAAARPDVTRLYTLGQSVQGRELWMMKISRNPDDEEDEPEVAYVAAMHGDEVVGKELCIELIHHLLDNDGVDPRATALIDGAEIWIMPSLNPDGTALNQRYNAGGFDLNRSFPDWFDDPVNTTAGRPPEVRAIMDWVAAHRIVLSANFHGGALVANYPWDNNETGTNFVFSPTPDPDHPAFLSIALTYAENNPPMHASSQFPDGVTNGVEWYIAVGGMQDWSYAWNGKFDVTMEISEVKWPPGSQLPAFWDDNRESMLSYLERAFEGVRGVVSDAATGAPVDAEIRLDDDPFAVFTDPDVGDFHRIVLPGSYAMHVSAPGYEPQTVPVTIAAGPAVRHDVALTPLPADLQPIAGRVEDGPSGNGVFDPGETADLAVTLKNLGNGATTIRGRLIPTGWFADVIVDEATYPDLDNQQTAESNSPHYTVAVDPAIPAGHKLGFAVEWSAAQGGGVSEPLFLEVGEATCTTEAATDVPQAINDYQTTTSELLFPAGQTVGDLAVPVDIRHTYIGDLVLTLRSPAGTEVVMHDRSGGGTDDIVGTYGVDLTPAEPLSRFEGEATGGTWTLTVEDAAGGDTGSVDSWSLQSCGRPAEAGPPEMRLREVRRVPGGTLLRWWPYPGLESYRVYRSTDCTDPGSFVDVTGEDADPTDTSFEDPGGEPLLFYLVTGVGAGEEGPKGHHGE